MKRRRASARFGCALAATTALCPAAAFSDGEEPDCPASAAESGFLEACTQTPLRIEIDDDAKPSDTRNVPVAQTVIISRDALGAKLELDVTMQQGGRLVVDQHSTHQVEDSFRSAR